MKLWLRTNGWDRLARELDLWGAARAVASFWWRDDDAVQPTPQLDELLGRAGRVPLALSVIPAKATEALAGRLRGEATVCVLQHGWRHESHVERRVDEYPAHRPAAEVAAELSAGRRRLGSLFGEQSIPVFVPPAHAFHTGFLPLLRRSGLAAISRKGARPSRPRVWSRPTSTSRRSGGAIRRPSTTTATSGSSSTTFAGVAVVAATPRSLPAC